MRWTSSCCKPGRMAGWMLPFGALAMLASMTPARSQVLFNNFGPGDTFTTDVGWIESGPTSFPGDMDQAETFTPSVSAALSTIEVAISHIPPDYLSYLGLPDEGGANTLDLFLAQDAGGLPGAVIESYHIDNLPEFFTSFSPELITSTLHPLLTAGTPYWLYADVTADTWDTWNENSSGDTGRPHAIRQGDGAWYIYTTLPSAAGAFRITGAPEVPEPGAFAFMLGGGMVGVAMLRRLRRR